MARPWQGVKRPQVSSIPALRTSSKRRRNGRRSLRALRYALKRTGSGRVQVTVHPHEGASGVSLVRGRVESLWQASVQMPSEEQWSAVPIVMGEPTAMWGHLCLSLDPSEGGWQASRESRRGTLGVCATKGPDSDLRLLSFGKQASPDISPESSEKPPTLA